MSMRERGPHIDLLLGLRPPEIRIPLPAADPGLTSVVPLVRSHGRA
jgi:hypothetical protein